MYTKITLKNNRFSNFEAAELVIMAPPWPSISMLISRLVHGGSWWTNRILGFFFFLGQPCFPLSQISFHRFLNSHIHFV